MTMIVVNVHEAKAKLSEYLEAAAKGERVLICNRNRPVAELRAVAPAQTMPRPVGGMQGQLAVPKAFFDPLPEDVVSTFYDAAGGSSPSRAAESSPAARRTAPRKARK